MEANTVADMSQSRPARAMSHPLRAPNKSSRNAGPPDPAELTRRLEAHLAAQGHPKPRRRRQSRLAEKDIGSSLYSIPDERPSKPGPSAPVPYRHVPQVAAVDFMNSATQDSMPGSHRPRSGSTGGHHAIAHAAFREHHARVPKVEPKNILTSAVARSEAEDRDRAHRRAIADRNQFQHDKIMEEAAAYDRERGVFEPVRRSFGADPLSVIVNGSRQRPVSCGEMNWEEGAHHRSADMNAKIRRGLVVPNVNDHLDWAQRDDTPVEHHSMRERLGPLLKKPDWGSKHKDAKNAPEIQDDAVPESEAAQEERKLASKARKSGFLGRFRREKDTHI